MEIQRQGDQTYTERVDDMIEWLASFGKTESGGVTRLLYSEAWKQAQLALKEKMEKWGFHSDFDCVGNLFGRLPGREKGEKTILTGSHIDSVIEGGKYDGAYGVVASILAVQRLAHLYGPPKKTIEIVSLCEEEGSRFPLTFWGSKNIQGVYGLKDAAGLRDGDGVPFFDAMAQAGFPPEAYNNPVRHGIERFIEVHVEQGTVLEKSRKPLGVVSHIVGQKRFTITIRGESNHAGTTPMKFRKDAMSTAAAFIAYLTEKAVATHPHLVATVGRMMVKPNVPNVIAGEVEFTLDIRNSHNLILEAYCRDIFAYLKQLAREASVDVSFLQWMDVRPVELDLEMNKKIKQIAKEKKIPFEEMVSGAGHDAQVFGAFLPTALLFVPSKDGISHSPKEFTSLEDLEMGIDVLSELLYQLAY